MNDVINRCAFRMKYQGSELKIWFLREDYPKSLRPLAEQTIPKDRWIGPDEFEVVTFPPIENAPTPPIAEALFGPNLTGGDFVPNPEIPGGNIALVETNNNKVQKPLENLVQMHARRETQVAFHQRIHRNHELVSAMNSGIADFLRDFSVQPAFSQCSQFMRA
jgi:hypothetical protein